MGAILGFFLRGYLDDFRPQLCLVRRILAAVISPSWQIFFYSPKPSLKKTIAPSAYLVDINFQLFSNFVVGNIFAASKIILERSTNRTGVVLLLNIIATFRRRFLPQLEALFVQVLLLAREMKLMKLGRIALDGTKIKANASKHKALSYGHLKKIEAQLKTEVSALTAQAEAADQTPVADSMDIPAEISRRETRLEALAAAKVKIEERAQERFAREQAEYQQKQTKRQAQRDTGKKPRGREPKPPLPGPRDKDQMNLTDEESRIMPVSGGGFEQCYNAQASVDTDTMLVVSTHMKRQTTNKAGPDKAEYPA